MKRTALLSGVLISLLLGYVGVSGRVQQQGFPPKPAIPIDPIAAIVDEFSRHAIVALGDGDHASEQPHAFRLSLIRDPRFATTVNDIVVESGSALYQDVIDRFVRGDDVPDA